MSRVFGLLGSGEFEPWAGGVDLWLLERASGDGSVLVLPSASAPEGDLVFDMWATMGLTHYQRLGIPAEVVPLKDRQDSERRDLAERVGTASMVFFSGGNPAYLTKILQGSRFWAAVVAGLDRGLAYGGCSAGVASLGEAAPDSGAAGATPGRVFRPGLRLFPGTYFGPHWNTLEIHIPGLQRHWISSVPPDGRLLAIDEGTAVVGDGVQWTVMGSGAAHFLESGRWEHHPSGKSFRADLTSGNAAPAADRP